MKWNWQQPDWPEFSWDTKRLAVAEERFLVRGGVLLGTIQHLDEGQRSRLHIEAMVSEAVSTSEIEGELLDRASVQSSLRRQLGLDTHIDRIPPAEQGVAEMMVDLYRTYAEPLKEETLFRWHRMLLGGQNPVLEVGRYRSSDAPMQIVSGGAAKTRVHFEAPPSRQVGSEMERFLHWFNQRNAGAIARSGIAHLYFESIHPFEDGNGRLGRAISEKCLAQSLSFPALLTLAPTIMSQRRAYYVALEAASTGNEVSEWLAWFAGVVLEAQSRSLAAAEFMTQRTKLMDRLRKSLNPRQEKTLVRMFQEDPTGFEGGLSAGNYASITGASPATSTRDLMDLVEKGALERRGELRHARYFLNIPITEIRRVQVAGDGSISEDGLG